MKRLFPSLIVIAVLLLLPFKLTFAEAPAQPAVVGFVGVLSTKAVAQEDGTIATAGVGYQIGQSQVWLFGFTRLGSYKSLSFEAAYLIRASPKLVIGLIAGPETDWVDNPLGNDLLAYIAGSVGFLGSYDLSPSKGIWTFGKYIVAKENQTWVQQGWVIGGGAFMRFSI